MNSEKFRVGVAHTQYNNSVIGGAYPKLFTLHINIISYRNEVWT